MDDTGSHLSTPLGHAAHGRLTPEPGGTPALGARALGSSLPKGNVTSGTSSATISHVAERCIYSGGSFQDNSSGLNVPNVREPAQKSQLFLPGNPLAGSDL